MSQRRVAMVPSLVILLLLSVPAAQAQDTWAPPRNAHDQPDLHGIWSHNSATPLERPKELADKDVLSDEELAELNQRIADRLEIFLATGSSARRSTPIRREPSTP